MSALALTCIGAAFYYLSGPDYDAPAAEGLAQGESAYADGRFDEAGQWFMHSARKGDKTAQYRLAMLYREGKGMDRDDAQAVRWMKLAARQGHLKAQYQLGRLLETGRGLDHADPAKAVTWYLRAAEHGHAAAQLRMAVMYAEGTGVANDDAMALRWALKAVASKDKNAAPYLQQLVNRIEIKAKNGDQKAQLTLAMIIQQGEVVRADLKSALKWLRQSAGRGNRDAQFKLAEVLLKKNTAADLIEARRWFLKAATGGHVQAQATIGVLAANGMGMPQNNQTALHWLTLAAKAGNARAQFNLGILYIQKKNAESDRLAVNWLRKAAESGLTGAQNSLAVMLALGRGAAREMQQSLRWLERAAVDNAMAQFNLGLIYLRGLSVTPNDETAANWLRKAQANGNARANLLLGLLYDTGKGVNHNEEKAVMYYQKAADMGDANAALNLALLYYKQGNDAPAFKLFARLARAGDTQSQNILATMLQQGRGSAYDISAALRWYRRAANAGDMLAQFNLANLLRKGEGVEQQDDQAVIWYRKSADQGCAPAQNSLAYMYAQGRGLPVDKALALQWLEKASAQGLAIAQKNILLLKRNLSGYSLTNFAVDTNNRTALLTDKHLDLERWLDMQQTPEL
jgi:TPR repeat protein